MAPQIDKPPIVVGILNVTPDSFSDGGLYLERKAAVEQAFRLREEGADYVEVGGESSRPGSEPVPLEEEWGRIEPVLREIAREIPTGVDTYKSEIAQRAIGLGAVMLNDISGLRADPRMADVAARSGAKLVIMQSKQQGSAPHATEEQGEYQDLVGEISQFLLRQARFAEERGVKKEQIIFDPGLGRFLSTDPEVSWHLLRSVRELCSHGYPVQLAASRKGFLGKNDTDPLSALLAVYGALEGISYVRTHHVRMTKQFLATWKKLTDV